MVSIKEWLFKILFRSEYNEIRQLRCRNNTLECEISRQTNCINADLKKKLNALTDLNRSLNDTINILQTGRQN